jgi:hypothetical protein
MKAAAGLGVLLGFGLAVGHAQGELPVPTLPTATVPIVKTTVKVPTVTAPKIPAPTPKVTTSVPVPKAPVPKAPTTSVPVPKAPVPVPQAPAPQIAAPAPTAATPSVPKTNLVAVPSATSASAGSGVQSQILSKASPSGGSGSSSSSAGQSSSPGSARSTDSAPGPARVEQLQASRPWIGTSGKKGRRATTLTFVLRRAQRVVFTVKQVSPECKTVGRFVVRGQAGLNRVRFTGRVNNKELDPGTYRIIARAQGGKAVRRVTIVVIEGPAPSRSELAALRSSNVCPSSTGIASTGINSSGLAGSLSEAGPTSLGPGERSASGPSLGLGSNPHPGGVLASAAEQTARAIRPALVALLAAAILLLAVASLPRVAVPDPRLNDVLARHRLEIASVGAGALIAVVISFMIG